MILPYRATPFYAPSHPDGLILVVDVRFKELSACRS
jgi:hypothetical protein